MSAPQPIGRKLGRLTLVGAGVAILLWLSLEDRDALAVSLLGGLAALGATLLVVSERGKGDRVSSRALLPQAGCLAGALAALFTPALMVFKNLRHGHAFPDYPPGMILALLERLPHWMLAGGLAGLGLGILLRLLADRREGGKD